MHALQMIALGFVDYKCMNHLCQRAHEIIKEKAGEDLDTLAG